MSPVVIQILIVACIALCATLLLARKLLAKVGVGRPSGKPDCGCGHCADKKNA